MLPTDEFLCGSGILQPPSPPPSRWRRRSAQWLIIGLSHAFFVGLALQVSLPARQALDNVIQASLITPHALPASTPEAVKPPSARQPSPVRAAPILAAAPRAEAPASLAVPEAPDERLPVVPATTEQPLPPPVIPPVFNAAYLDNPPPHYPASSRRLGEKGRVVLRIFVSADGRAERIELKASSGFDRLDLAAREAVSNWRFIPARRGSENIAAWVLVPISFVM